MSVDLQKDVIYGPGNSRRLRKSLGINPLPLDRKVCTMSCIYCLYGRNKPVPADVELKDAPSIEYIAEKLQRRLQETDKADAVTFSGNGEPTLYPSFYELVKEV